MQVFICHASEDKKKVATPLANALRSYNIDVWYDEYSISPGDSIYESISKGLMESEFGVIIISKVFLDKKSWNKKELNSLFSLFSNNKTKIIPIWHNINVEDIKRYEPLLIDIQSINFQQKFEIIIEKLLDVFWKKMKNEVDINNYAPTGIEKLDRILGGGLKRRSSIIIEGPKGVGKTTLGMHIQREALIRGDSCLYITYTKLPLDVLERFHKIFPNIEHCIDEKRFKILDNYSAINKIKATDTYKSIKEHFSEKFCNAIIHVDDPYNLQEYHKIHAKVLEGVGPSINIIDSTNKRYDMLGGQKSEIKKSEQYFNRQKSNSTLKNNLGIHIVQDLDKYEKLKSLLGNLQDGIIRLQFVHNVKTKKNDRYLQIENIGIADKKQYQFTIRNGIINIF